MLRAMTTYPMSPEDREIQERTRRFVDEELIPWEEHAEEHDGLIPEVLRHVHREQPQLPDEPVVACTGVLGDQAVVLLGMLLPGDQLLVDESTGALLDLTVFGRHRVRGHAAEHRTARSSGVSGYQT
jgi:hypothetical protein